MNQNAARCETLMQPTGKPLLDPQEVFVPEALGYDQLVSLLSQLQIPVQHDDVITSLRGRHDAQGIRASGVRPDLGRVSAGRTPLRQN